MAGVAPPVWMYGCGDSVDASGTQVRERRGPARPLHSLPLITRCPSPPHSQLLLALERNPDQLQLTDGPVAGVHAGRDLSTRALTPCTAPPPQPLSSPPPSLPIPPAGLHLLRMCMLVGTVEASLKLRFASMISANREARATHARRLWGALSGVVSTGVFLSWNLISTTLYCADALHRPEMQEPLTRAWSFVAL